MSLGSRIYERRSAHNLSQVDLADLLEVSRQSVSKWETDASVPDLDKLVKMCEVFQVSMDWLVLGKTPDPPPDAPPPASWLPALSRQTVGTALAALGLLTLILMAAARGDIIAGVFLAIPFLACGGLCFLAKQRRTLILGCGWVACGSLLFCLCWGTGWDLASLLSFALGNGYTNSNELYAAGFLALLDLIVLAVLFVFTLAYDQIFPPERKKKS